MNRPHRMNSLQSFVSIIDATGGVVRFSNGLHAPEADHDWIDLGETYIVACAELGQEPLVRRATSAENLD